MRDSELSGQTQNIAPWPECRPENPDGTDDGGEVPTIFYWAISLEAYLVAI